METGEPKAHRRADADPSAREGRGDDGAGGLGGAPGAPRRAAYRAFWGYRDAGVAERYHRRRYQRLDGRLRAFFVRRAVRRALRLAGVARGIVLDIPCGSGVAGGAVAAAGLRCVGADVSLPMVQLARREAAAPRDWVCADIERLPFRAGAFQAVVCLRFFPHLPAGRWGSVLGALAAISSGPVLVGLPMRRSSKHWWRAFKRLVGVEAKRRPIFPTDEVAGMLLDLGLCLRHRVWQSPFTDTALAIVTRAEDA